MSIGSFTDKAHQPTSEEIEAAIEPWQQAWQDLAAYVRETYAAKEDFGFYGKNYGWALRFRKGGKALLSLYPVQGGFTIQAILGEAHVAEALKLPLGEHVQQIITGAHPYPEGRWLFIPVMTAQDLDDVKTLLAVKSSRTLSPTPSHRGQSDAPPHH